MGAMKHLRRLGALAILTGCLVPITSSGRSLARPADFDPTPDAALFSRTASQTLARDFSSPAISYLFYDSRDDSFIASQWSERARPVPIGSLGKPFTALAYAETHDFRFPEHVCTGGSSCWLPKGHGALGIVAAIAFSCNSYFTQLASDTGGLQVTTVARRFGLNGPGANASPEAVSGRFGVWREAPESLVRAYAKLLGRSSQPAVREIVAGMAESARLGTAASVSRQGLHQKFLAKTGTAPCTHTQHAPGDGFVIVAWPADFPRYLLLVRQHGVPGAQTAALAGRMLRALEP
jgi:cell division protein FtsI/penicillin-binding protein 2